MAKSKKEEIKSRYESAISSKVAKDVKEHYKDSWDYVVSPRIVDWEEKESILLGTQLDDISQTTKSNVNDPRLSTISIERAARVNAQNPSGKALAMSSDDRGKNMLMNLIMDKWVLPNANSQFDYLIKNRLWDLYSDVYGVMFKLVDYVTKDNYQGPDSFLLPIRDVRPQPGKFSPEDCDWMGVSSWVTPDWLKIRNKDTWKNVDQLITKAKEGGATTKGENDTNRRTYIEQQRQPSLSKDKAFPQIEIYTEYRKDKWITIAPDHPEIGVLRNIENPHQDDTIPIIAKYCFPLLDSIYGLGEFERGKTLQFAINSLINLYLDGVKYSIFPPLLTDPDGVIPSSMVNEPAAIWLQTKPGSITPLDINPKGIESFQSTYNFLIAAVLNQAGTTDTTVSSSTDNTQGKTPQALKLVSQRENARDSWDRFMMEKALEQEMKKYVNLIANKQEKNIELRLFAKEIQDIQKIYPDVVELVDGSDRGKVTVKPDVFKDGDKSVLFDYQIVSGSTYKADQDKELTNTTNLLNIALNPQQGPALQAALKLKGKMIDIGELFTRSVVASGMQDSEKIIVDIPPQQLQQEQMQHEQDMALNSQNEGMVRQGFNGLVPNEIPPIRQGQITQQSAANQFEDPDINQLASELSQGL